MRIPPAAKALGVSLTDARAASDALDRAALAAVGVQVETLGEGPPAPPGRRFPPLTSGARAVFQRAIDEARPARSGRIEATHFLLALLSRRRPVERVGCGAGGGQGHPEGFCRRGILLVHQPEQQVIGAEPAVAAAARLLGG